MKNKLLIVALVLCLLLFGVKLSSAVETQETPVVKETEGDVVEIPEVVPEPEPIKPDICRLSILGAGDVMCHSPQFNAAYDAAVGKYDFTENYTYVKDIVESYDLAFANYETRSLVSAPFTGYPRFNSPAEIIDALKYAGFDVLSTANNHSMDMDIVGIGATIDEIESRGLINIGTFKQSPERRYEIIQRDGFKIGVMCYTYGLNGLEPILFNSGMSDCVNLINVDKMKEDISLMKEDGVDFTMLYLHMGEEYQPLANDMQKKLVNELFVSGLDVVFASHPHVVQDAELVEIEGKKHFVIYSMGNYISNQRLETMGNAKSEDGLMVGMDIVKNFDTGEVDFENIRIYPTWVLKRITPSTQYFIIPLENALAGKLETLAFTEAELVRMNKSFDDTMNTVKASGFTDYVLPEGR